jgi:hypothetical protein
MDHLSALCHCSSAWVPSPTWATTSITGRAPTSQRPRLRLPIITTELEGHPRSQPSRSATRVSSSVMMASRGQPSAADLRSSRLHPKLRYHPALLLGPRAGRPDHRPVPPPLFSPAKLLPPWRAAAGKSPSSLKPKVDSLCLLLALATVRPHLIDGPRRISQPPMPLFR